MKRTSIVILALLSLTLITGCSRGYESQINAGALNIMLKSDRYPLRIGSNQLAVIIVGPSQRTVTDAHVEVRFYMSNPSGVVPVGSKTDAALVGDKYFFTVEPALAGAWKLDLTVKQPGKQPVTTAYYVDVQ